MPKEEYKSVAIKFDTYTRLIRRKKYPEESFDKVINRILDGNVKEQQIHGDYNEQEGQNS